MRLIHGLSALPLILALPLFLAPAAQAQEQQNCKFERQAGAGDSALHNTMTVRPGRSCVYMPRPGRSSRAATFNSMEVSVKPQHGSVSVNENGGQYRVLYAPNAGYVGNDHFELTAGILGNPAGEKRMVDVVVAP